MVSPKVLDCTIRDGGLMNRWQFDDQFVRQLVLASQTAGSDYVELGYKASTNFFDPRVYGKWRFCREDILRDFWNPDHPSVLTVMLDIGRFDPRDMIPAADSVIGAVRVACYVAQIEEGIAATQILDRLGYQTFLNIMAVSEAEPSTLESD